MSESLQSSGLLSYTFCLECVGLSYFLKFRYIFLSRYFHSTRFDSTIFIFYLHSPVWRQFPYLRMFSYVSYWIEFRITFCSQIFVCVCLAISFYIYPLPLFNSFFSFRLTYLYIYSIFSRLFYQHCCCSLPFLVR